MVRFRITMIRGVLRGIKINEQELSFTSRRSALEWVRGVRENIKRGELDYTLDSFTITGGKRSAAKNGARRKKSATGRVRHAMSNPDAVTPMQNAEALRAMIQSRLDAPFVMAQISTLGGGDRPSVMVTVSLDPKSQWTNGILQNSRYAQMSFNFDGRKGVNEAEQFSGQGLTKMRAFKFATPDDAMKKLAKWVAAQK